MIYSPGPSKELKKHIEHYWIVKDAPKLFKGQFNLLAFPGVTPDLILVLDGYCQTNYLGKRQQVRGSYLYSFIHDTLALDASGLRAFILIRFKSRGLSSLLPFIDISAETMIQNSVVKTEYLFGKEINGFIHHLKSLSEMQIVEELDSWLLSAYKKEREGFMIDLAQEVSENFDIGEIRAATNYSYSTLQRYFKKDTGLTPKKFQSLRRFKRAVQEICTTENTDWSHYVDQYGYFDQAHFIKEIKRYTSFTPAQLVQVPSFVKIRPA